MPTGYTRPNSYAPLYFLLVERFPTYRTSRGLLDIPGLARDMGYASETIYRSVRKSDGLTLGTAYALIKFSHAHEEAVPIYWSDLLPILLPEYENYKSAPGDTDDTDDIANLLD